MKYCLHCDWHASATDEPSARARSRAAIDHHVETGHAVDSSDGVIPPQLPDVPAEIFVDDLVPSSD
ncbi:hypothetical protein Htur_3240 [Haloterrigena turkmenica DSM 5511]|uniref:Uncharacterized protein n=1 Tax=Haloterrigena turkmenica (strain ATCC 51198 / DSM 5511 / JCM 9101 / NCIMB 13204 / VKM B-1734 / 4k) TaxID=543526 RepID=D2RZR5_HALTV|nr:hypothetical protein [Haloterrigena turkmenica]ADB62104.1 hypothetical protein Htur_3240 [Haloterrigena turkmenica DSM 5511]